MSKHEGKDKQILLNRIEVYTKAREKHPARWKQGIRNWKMVEEVSLNPHGKEMKEEIITKMAMRIA